MFPWPSKLTNQVKTHFCYSAVKTNISSWLFFWGHNSWLWNESYLHCRRTTTALLGWDPSWAPICYFGSRSLKEELYFLCFSLQQLDLLRFRALITGTEVYSICSTHKKRKRLCRLRSSALDCINYHITLEVPSSLSRIGFEFQTICLRILTRSKIRLSPGDHGFSIEKGCENSHDNRNSFRWWQQAYALLSSCSFDLVFDFDVLVF